MRGTLSEQIEANKLTIAELEAVVALLDQFELTALHTTLKAALAKMRWHIAASRNEWRWRRALCMLDQFELERSHAVKAALAKRPRNEVEYDVA